MSITEVPTVLNTAGSIPETFAIHNARCGDDIKECDVPPSAAIVVSGVISRLRLKEMSHTVDQAVWLVVESLAYTFIMRKSSHYLRATPKGRRRVRRALGVCASRLGQFLKQDRYQDYAKYWTSRWAARVFADEEQFPVKAEFENLPLFTGILHTWLARAVKARDRDMAYSLLQSKRMWPQLGDERAAEALQDHQNLMAAVPGVLDAETKHWLSEAVDSFLSFAHDPVWSKVSPSVSGHYGAVSSTGGALGAVRWFAGELGIDLQGVSSQSLWHLWRSGEEEKQKLYEVAERMLPLKGESRARVVLVPEPAKFRIVTCGDPFLYTFVQPLQAEMLKAWSRHPSATMRVQDLGASMSQWSKRSFFISGDYKSATDLLNVNASRYVLEQVCMRWKVPLKLAEASLLTLSGTVLQYPLDVVLAEEEVEQTNGQLMGSPLSFPLLCIINLSTWLRATADRRLRGELPRRYDVHINGDDIGFPASWSEYNAWKGAANRVGFQLSLGKSYASREVALINSQLFKYPTFKRVGYLNLKLCKGSSLKAGHSDAWDYQVGRAVTEMCSLSPWTIPFVPMAMQSATRFLPNSNWYLPTERGGCGVSPRFSPDNVRLTRWQRKLAGASSMHPELSLGVSAAVPGLGRVLKLIGSPRRLTNFDPFEGSEDAWWPDLEARERDWTEWFARIIGYIALVGNGERKMDEARKLAWRVAVRKWESAAKVAQPMSILKLWEPSEDLYYPYVPPVLPPVWAVA